MNYLHERVRAVRDQKKISQQALADLANVPRSQLQLLEGGGNVTRNTIEKVLGPLGLHLVVITTEEMQALRTLSGAQMLPPPEQDSAAGYIPPELYEKIRQINRMIDEKGHDTEALAQARRENPARPRPAAHSNRGGHEPE